VKRQEIQERFKHRINELKNILKIYESNLEKTQDPSFQKEIRRRLEWIQKTLILNELIYEQIFGVASFGLH
jgi:hypothetical protein